MFFHEERNYAPFSLSFHPSAFNIFKVMGSRLLVVLGLRREVSRTVVVRYWYVLVEVEGHVDGHFRVVRRCFGCGALGFAGTCSQGSADSVGSALVRLPAAEVRASRSFGFH